MDDSLSTIALPIATIAAILVGPWMAIQVSRILDVRKEIRERKLNIFKTLMTTRATKLSESHVEALNQIDLEFAGNNKNDKQVIKAWKYYLAHLLSTDTSGDIWVAKSVDLFVELLQTMADVLEFEFDKIHIKNSVYRPVIHDQIESERLAILQGCRQLLHHERWLPVYDATNEIIAALKQKLANAENQSPESAPK